MSGNIKKYLTFPYKNKLILGYYQKIILAITLVTLLASMSVGVVAYQIAEGKSRESQSALIMAKLTNAASNINLMFTEIKTVSYSFLFDQAANEILTESTAKLQYYQNYDILHPIAASIKGYHKAVHAVTIFTKRGDTFSYPIVTDYIGMNYDNCLLSYEQLGIDLMDETVYWNRVDRVFDQKKASGYFCGACLYRDPYTLEKQGIILTTIRESSLQKSLSELPGYSYIIDAKGNFLTAYAKGSPLEDQASARITAGETSFVTTNSNVKMLVSAVQIPVTGWYAITCIEYDTLAGESRIILRSIALALMLSLLISLLIAAAISNQLTNTLHSLTDTMHSTANGNLSIRCQVQGSDEVSYLADQFNIMLDHIEQYIKESKSQEAKSHRAEIKLQQALINPHLLYNSLDSVIWKLEQGRFDDASAALLAMSEFFKLSLARGRILVPISQEIRLVENYILLQNRCRGKSHKLIIDSDAILVEAPIVKMSIQPLVENAIMHGFDGYCDSGEIRITITRGELTGSVQIVVMDNGQGMLPEELETLRASFHSPVSPSDSLHHFGLYSVYVRLQHFFGDKFTFAIFSSYMEYTRFVINIPLLTDDEKLSITD